MSLREYKKLARRDAIVRLEKVAWYLDRMSKDAPVATIPTPEEFRRELMAMHVDERELLLASSDLHAIIDDLSLILPASKGGAS